MFLKRIRRLITRLGAIQHREKIRISEEMREVRGLMPLLMKRRNGHKWSVEDKREIRRKLQTISHLSPYIAMLLLPFGFFLLPLFVWWLDRRRKSARQLALKNAGKQN